MQLSIITINRNNEVGLRKTMRSVLSQNWVDFEYIIIDGASTDKSVDVIQEEINKASKSLAAKIQFCSETDTGVFNAMNKGIAKAQGDYLLFLNSGDFLIDNHVLSAVFNEDHNADILSCKCRVTKNSQLIFITTPPINYTFGFFYSNSLAHQATFIKESLFDEYGYYREELKFMGDWEFFLRTIILGNATTKNMDIIVSDYNVDGISSIDENQEAITKEKQMVYQQSVLRNFLADYKFFESQKKEFEIISWAWNRSLFRWPIKCIYSAIKLIKM